MTLLEIFLIGIGLAMDCFAVSIASSIAYGKYDWRKILRMAFAFGLLQGLMPIGGWVIGIGFSSVISAFDHWFAFLILGFLGCKMIIEGYSSREESFIARSPYSSLRILSLLALATSIDALATGLIFVPTDGLIWVGAVIIGVVSFLFTITGCVIGVSFASRFKLNVAVFGGMILIVIGVKILIEHLFF